jgi:hypothetical protein
MNPIVVAAGRIAEALATTSTPWASVYAHHRAVSTAVIFLHVAPLVFGAGAAFVMDRATLSASRGGPIERFRHLGELARVHRVVLSGLTLSFVSGLLMFLSDVTTFLGAMLFWVKIGLVALLLANGFLLTRTEHALLTASNTDALWRRMRTLSVVSAVLWLATTFSGVVLMQFS